MFLVAYRGFQLLDALFRGRVCGGGSGSGLLNNCQMRGVPPALSWHRAPALDAIAPLGLVMTQLVAADFAHYG